RLYAGGRDCELQAGIAGETRHEASQDLPSAGFWEDILWEDPYFTGAFERGWPLFVSQME
ncbi:MAG: hypothetical protein WBM06_24525, partial [Pseudolabrys sp.]